MSFESRISHVPRPFDLQRAADVMALLPELPPNTTDLLRGVAGSSPYLAGLIVRERDWLLAALDDPEAATKSVLSAASVLSAEELATGLREAKRRIAVLTAIADLGRVWPLETVTRTLSLLADVAVDTCLKRLVGAEIARGKIPGLTQDDAQTAAGMVALAMGKGGAFELNYSSDIDLILLFDGDRLDPAIVDDARASFIKVTRRMTGILSDATDQGYVFRTDLRLRPDASVTPVCLSMAAAEHYYESVGRTWERAAFIKARAAAGDIEAGARFLTTLTPFVWRKHLDFAAIQDAHDMRLRIRDHKRLNGPLRLDGHNVKLGHGGIREIEFFTQTRQLIAGGRDPSLRVSGTRQGLRRLADAGWVDEADAATLYGHYKFLRDVEHRLQMIADQQTHALPTSDDGWDRLAALMGTTVIELRNHLEETCQEVHALTEGFFAPGQVRQPVDDFGAEFEERWRTYPALRSSRAVELFKRLKPQILTHLKSAAKPQEALLQFDGFLRGLPAGVQLFSLFEANPQLTRMIVDICATSPALATYLARNSAVLDMVIGGSFFSQWPGVEALVQHLHTALALAGDYEARLNAARRWMKEWHFRIGVHHLRGLISARDAGFQYADLAQAVIAGLWTEVVAEFSRKHGAPPGRGAVVLGMGSLGAARLNAGSDLDLIMIYDADGLEMSQGPRPLAARPYYARLTQALVTAVTAPMSDGRLYEVDMRLRPSGRQGPVATSLSAFRDYQLNEAWTWEHLALTRARAIAGTPDLMPEVETIRQEILTTKAKGQSVLADVADMRRRIAEAKSPKGLWDAKIGPGRLQDIELCAQTATLLAGGPDTDPDRQIHVGVASGWMSAADGTSLRSASDLLWRLQAAARLLTGDELDPQTLGEGGKQLILRETGFDDLDSLAQALQEAAQQADQIISRLLDLS